MKWWTPVFWSAIILSLGRPLEAAWINDAAPDFTLMNTVGESRSLSAHKGRVVFVHFWASWCTPCKEEFPKMNRFAGAYRPEDFALLAITVDKTQMNIGRFLKKYIPDTLHAEVLRDPEGKAADVYRNRAMPITFVIDRKGVIRFAHVGFQEGDEARWKTEVDLLLKEGK